MRAILYLAFLLVLSSPVMADCLVVQVVEYIPVGDQRYSALLLADPANLDDAIERIEIVNVELRDVDTVDSSGKRVRKKRYYYFTSIVLNAAGYESLKKLQSALGKPNRGLRRGVRVIVNDSGRGQRFWLDHKEKTAHLRLVLFEEQLFPLLKIVKKPWEDNPEGNTTIGDWKQGKGVPENASLIE